MTRRRDGQGPPAPRFRPFADEAVVVRLGGLTVENRTDRVSLGGGLDLTRDRAGLAAARELLGLIAAVVAALEGEGEALPDALPPPASPLRVPNPFGGGDAGG